MQTSQQPAIPLLGGEIFEGVRCGRDGWVLEATPCHPQPQRWMAMHSCAKDENQVRCDTLTCVQTVPTRVDEASIASEDSMRALGQLGRDWGGGREGGNGDENAGFPGAL